MSAQVLESASEKALVKVLAWATGRELGYASDMAWLASLATKLGKALVLACCLEHE